MFKELKYQYNEISFKAIYLPYCFHYHIYSFDFYLDISMNKYGYKYNLLILSHEFLFGGLISPPNKNLL